MATLITTRVSKKERIEYFAELLKQQEGKFDNAASAFLYLKETLKKAEDALHKAQTGRMGIDNFELYEMNKHYGVFFHDMQNHTIIINPNGAYGIYHNEKIHGRSLSFYKAGNNKIIEIESSKGEPLW